MGTQLLESLIIPMSQIGVLVTAIFAVLFGSAVMCWTLWRFTKSVENPQIVRRRFFWVAAIYGFGAFSGIEQVITGQAPVWSLVFLPISLAFIWFYVRAARRISVPPSK